MNLFPGLLGPIRAGRNCDASAGHGECVCVGGDGVDGGLRDDDTAPVQSRGDPRSMMIDDRRLFSTISITRFRIAITLIYMYRVTQKGLS